MRARSLAEASFFTDLRFLHAKLISISSNELVRREAYRLGVDITNFWTRSTLYIHSILALYAINRPKLPIRFLFSDLDLLSKKIHKESIVTSFVHAKEVIKGNAFEVPSVVSGFHKGKCHFSFVPKF